MGWFINNWCNFNSWTAHQVLVNGTSGSAQKGNVTLSLPQSIDVTSSPTFVNITGTLQTASQPNITGVGTITTGIWNATPINANYINYISTNLTNISGALDTIQDIATSSTPIFKGITLWNGAAANYILTCTDSAGDSSWENFSTLGVTSLTGTANQVLVNNTVGTAQKGDLTLSLPQSIATNSTPTFSGLTVNGNINSESVIPISADIPTLGSSSNYFRYTYTHYLFGGGTIMNANDSIYIGTQFATNFFLDRPIYGGTFIYGYNTGQTTGQSAIMQVYNNSTNRTVLMQLNSNGLSTGNNSCVFGAPRVEISADIGITDSLFRFPFTVNPKNIGVELVAIDWGKVRVRLPFCAVPVVLFTMTWLAVSVNDVTPNVNKFSQLKSPALSVHVNI